MRAAFTFIALAAAVSAVSAANIVITVGGNGTSTFNPPRVDAKVGDIVVFNFTSGNHSATQSTFDVPCLPAHESNNTLNGFDSGLRPTNNGTAITILTVPILDSNVGAPFWFYDEAPGACGIGAVGAINSNESSTATLAGFVRNAERLNGTAASSSAASATTSGSSGSPSPSTSTSAAQQLRVAHALPLLLAALGLSAF